MQVRVVVKLRSTQVLLSSSFAVIEYFFLYWNVISEERKLCQVVVEGFECFLFQNVISEKEISLKNPIFIVNGN